MKNLITDHVPQDELVVDIISAIKILPGVDGIIQRGSYAKGSVDRASDLDILVIVDDAHLESFLEKYVEKLQTTCAFLHTEGWIDTIVPDFGGVGVVFLVVRDERLIQLDMYITAASGAAKILNFPAKHLSFETPKLIELRKTGTKLTDESKIVFETYKTKVRPGFQQLLEVAILYEIYAKHIFRRNATLALKYRYSLIESVAILIRSVFTPGRTDYKMYDWSGDFGSINSPLVKMFERNIELIDTYSERQLKDLGRVITILYFESALRTKYPEFENVFAIVEEYVEDLLNPQYLVGSSEK
jgi:hypothetical protein